jgi:hypothetical protein
MLAAVLPDELEPEPLAPDDVDEEPVAPLEPVADEPVLPDAFASSVPVTSTCWFTWEESS